jgi:O-antigen/teichoic acid export membrane protein
VFRALLQVVQTAILARILAPSDFGLMAIAGSVMAVYWLFADLGVSQAIIHYDEVPMEALAALYWLNLAVGFVLMCVLAASAPLVGLLYKAPGLVPLLLLGSLVFPLSAAGQQHRVVAQKELRFSALARNELASNLAGFSAAVVIALLGGGVYALIAGVLVTAATSSVLAWWRLSLGPPPPLSLHFGAAAPYLRFGTFLLAEKLANTLYRQVDVFVAGLIARPSQLGLYSVPRDLSLRFALLVNPVVTRVAFPVMARSKHDRDLLKNIYLNVLRATSSVNFPIYLAMAVFSNELVAVVYGSRFHGAGAYLRILAIWGLLRSIGNPVGSLLYAVGMTKRSMVWNIGMLCLLPVVYYGSAKRYGLEGMAYSLIAAQLALLIPGWWLLVRPSCGARLTEFLSQLLVPISLSAISGLAAALVAGRVAEAPWRLFAGIGAGSVTYLALSYRFNRPWLDSMFELTFPPSTRSFLKRG